MKYIDILQCRTCRCDFNTESLKKKIVAVFLALKVVPNPGKAGHGGRHVTKCQDDQAERPEHW